MSIKLTEMIVNHPYLPMRWKLALMVLAFKAKKNDGTDIFMGLETLARYIGAKHRQTAGKVLAEITRAGLVKTVRRGGRLRKTTLRALDLERIAAYTGDPLATKPAHKRCNRTVASASDHATAQLHRPARSCNRAVAQIVSRSKRKRVRTRDRPVVRTSTSPPLAPTPTPDEPTKKERES